MILYLSSTGCRSCGRILFHAELRLDINVMSIMIVILLRNLRVLFDPNLILVFLQNRLHRRITVIFRRYLLSEMTRLRCNHFALVSVMAFRAGAFDFFSLCAAAAAGLGAVMLFNEKRGGLSAGSGVRACEKREPWILQRDGSYLHPFRMLAVDFPGRRWRALGWAG